VPGISGPASGNDCRGALVGPIVQALTLLPRVRSPRSADRTSAVAAAAKVVAVAGVAAYNWWVVVPFVPGLMPTVNGFFSDLEATGRPHAGLMSDADMAAGILMAAALLLRGSAGPHGARREWKWMMAFAVAGAVGGRFPYACSEGLSAACRTQEWNLQLPLHHYVHVVSGIAEFVTLTTAAVIAMRRTRSDGTRESHIYSGLVKVLIVSYPILGAVYITDRLGTLVEPIFFIAFSVMLLTEVFEPIGRTVASPTWTDRTVSRGTRGMALAPDLSAVDPRPQGGGEPASVERPPDRARH
jgi:Protein of unknown function (DUF998)